MKKKLNIWIIIFIIISIVLFLNNAYLLLNIKELHNIENTLRLVGSIILGIFTLLMIFINIKVMYKKNKLLYVLLIIINLFIIGIIGFININFSIIYNKLNKVTTNYTTYSISLVTKIDSNIKTIDNIGNNDIGVTSDHEIANGYTFAEQILKSKKLNNKLVEYDSYFEIIDDLISEKIKVAFLPSNYIEAFQTVEGYEDISTKLKTIYDESKKEAEETTFKSIDEPFTVLLMGVDGTGDGISNMTANGDSLILVTFNPKTFNATMLSIPRDSYVPISCMGGKKNKITHSSWGGERCIMNTIQNLLNIKIDYYVKINFNGVVQLVDTLGGIDVNVEYNFCEQNSQRLWGEWTVYVEKGFHTINGEQALAYARNRHPNPSMCGGIWSDYDSNDFIRGSHQQDIIKAILTKVKNIRDLNTIYNLMDTISNNVETNMDTNTMLSFYNIAKDLTIKLKTSKSIDDLVNIEKLYLNGYGAMIYDYSQKNNSGSRLVLWDYVLYKGSVNDVANAMKLNLGLDNIDAIKTFDYDSNTSYTKQIIGKKYYSEASVELLPDFTGQTKEQVTNYADAHNIKLTIEYSTGEGTANTVISQEPGARMDLSEMIDSKGLKVVIKEAEKVFDYTECTKEEYKEDKRCAFIDYTGKSYEEFSKWLNKYTNIKKNITYNIIDENNESYNENKIGIIKSITINDIPITNMSIYEIKDSKVVVTYYGKKTEKEEDNEDTENKEDENPGVPNPEDLPPELIPTPSNQNNDNEKED